LGSIAGVVKSLAPPIVESLTAKPGELVQVTRAVTSEGWLLRHRSTSSQWTPQHDGRCW